MAVKIIGTVERRDIGMGVWVLVTNDGVTYEIMKGPDKTLLKAGNKVEVMGEVRDDVMTVSMIGPVLEVKSFDIQNG
jgi:hypothetical protein